MINKNTGSKVLSPLKDHAAPCRHGFRIRPSNKGGPHLPETAAHRDHTLPANPEGLMLRCVQKNDLAAKRALEIFVLDGQDPAG